MISNRPILYLTLPSLALIIGYVWLRRKKGGRAVCDTGGKEQSSSSNKSCKLLGEGLGDNQELSDQAYSAHNSQHTESLPIGTPKQQKKKLKLNLNQSPPRNKQPGEKQQSQSPGSAASSSSSLGKSAPIDIAPNPRSPPKRVTEQEIDCEILKLKPQESDIKHLRYIEEPEIDWDESPTPADSPLYRDRFDLNRSQPKVEPVVIKGTLEAKISPENSFRERKYTQTEADDSAHLKESAKAEETNSKMENGTAATDNGCVMMQEDAEVVAATSTTAEVPKKSQSDVCIEPQIASPSLSVCSMHSGDSGQGSSPPQSVGAPQVTYDFMIPPSYVGALIGFRGSIITNIKDKTGANVVIRKSIPGKKHKVCSIEGTQSEVDAALKLIRVKMPEKRYPYMSMERIFVTPDNKVVPTFNASTLHLQLIEGINNDVTISNIVSGGHLFLHQPLHPSYPSLSSLQHRMNQWYSMTTAPELPEIIDSAICALCVQDNWYRVQIVSHSSQAKTSIVKYLDFGGFMTVKSSELRQIHADFMSVPFQAIECVLSNIRAPGDGEWSQEAADTITSFTQGVIMQAQIAGYTQDELPEIYLYVSITKDNVLFINQELCARQLAEWVPNEQEG